MGREISSRRKAEKIAILRKRDGKRCWLCGEKMDFHGPRTSARAATLDHVIPRSLGGPNADTNLRLAHRSCNNRRGDDLTEADWAS